MDGKVSSRILKAAAAFGWLAAAVTPVSAIVEDTAVVVVLGAPGQEEYVEKHAATEEVWRARCAEAGAAYHAVGVAEADGKTGDREQLRDLIGVLAKNEGQALWVVLLGHGTFDGKTAKFNLRGPDVTADELAEWLSAKKGDLVLINTTASSAPFLTQVAGPGRIVITATKSGSEIFYTRFGRRFADALASPEADLDHDGQTSLLETFLHAARRVADSFEEAGLIATEHALIDDNGDRKGTRADWFQGVRVEKKAEDEALPDGLRAHQVHLIPSEAEKRFPPELRRRRNDLELKVTGLRLRKGEMPEDEYYAGLEAIFLEIAEVYRQAEAAGTGEGKGSAGEPPKASGQ